MPDSSIKEIKGLMNSEDLTHLSKKDRDTIYNKLKENGGKFDKKENAIFKNLYSYLKRDIDSKN